MMKKHAHSHSHVVPPVSSVLMQRMVSGDGSDYGFVLRTLLRCVQYGFVLRGGGRRQSSFPGKMMIEARHGSFTQHQDAHTPARGRAPTHL